MKRRITAIIFKIDNRGREQIIDILRSRNIETIAYESPENCPLQKTHDCQCSDSQTCTDILISDLDMPGVSGLDYLESQIKKGCKTRVVALMSSNWSTEDIKRAEKMGCTVFEKPTRRYILEEWIDNCMERINLDSELNDWFID